MRNLYVLVFVPGIVWYCMDKDTTVEESMNQSIINHRINHTSTSAVNHHQRYQRYEKPSTPGSNNIFQKRYFPTIIYAKEAYRIIPYGMIDARKLVPS